jgi:predicted Zn-dependent protease
MKFTAKLPDDNVNVSKTHPLAEFAWLLGGLVLIIGVAFFSLGFITDWAAGRTPISVENWLGQQALEQFPVEENAALKERLQALLDEIPADADLQQYNFRIFLSDTDEVNAVALPGGNIVVFAGLIEQMESENELAMVLAHELAHFARRDHLRGLGRGLGLTVAAALLFGEQNAASNLVSQTLLTYQLRYSQAQESAADRFALDLLTKRYGHAGGSTDFFARLAQQAGSQIPYLLASHPHPQARIDQLQRLIEERNYPLAATVPLAVDLLTESIP